MDRSAIANSVHWYCRVLRREDGHVLITTLDTEADDHKRKERTKKTWKKQDEE